MDEDKKSLGFRRCCHFGTVKRLRVKKEERNNQFNAMYWMYYNLTKTSMAMSDRASRDAAGPRGRDDGSQGICGVAVSNAVCGGRDWWPVLGGGCQTRLAVPAAAAATQGFAGRGLLSTASGRCEGRGSVDEEP